MYSLKEMIVMKKKLIKDTYLLGVEDYDINIIKDEKCGAYVAAKHIKEIDKPYIETHSGKNVCFRIFTSR